MSGTNVIQVTSAGNYQEILVVPQSDVGAASGVASLDGSTLVPTTQIPNLAASKITSGQLALARGGTNADLSATGGTSQVLKQVSSGAAITVAQLAFTDLSGSLAASQLPAFSGDVTTSAGSSATTLANIPSAVPMAGSLLATAITAPGTPAAGKGSIYVDSTSKNLSIKDDAGVVKHGVQTKASVASNFLTAISDAGLVSAAQPAFTDISGTASTGQIPNLAASKITSGQIALAQGGTNADLSATGGTSQVLKQVSSGAAITVGQLAASDLSNGTTGSGSIVLASGPALTGTPTAPTASNGTNTTQIATTAYVLANAGGVSKGQMLAFVNHMSCFL